MSKELEATSSTRVRAVAMAADSGEAALQGMVGHPVAKYLARHALGEKMAGRERWTPADKEFKLYSG